MPDSGCNPLRERQYWSVQEIVCAGRAATAARTVNNERARRDEARPVGRESNADISSGRRVGLPSHRGAAGRTRMQLSEGARRYRIKARSSCARESLEAAFGRAQIRSGRNHHLGRAARGYLVGWGKCHGAEKAWHRPGGRVIGLHNTGWSMIGADSKGSQPNNIRTSALRPPFPSAACYRAGRRAPSGGPSVTA